MPISTWVDKITNESNTWFNACKLLDMGNYVDAIILYLDDAAESLRIDSPVRAGLSCSCAADCLVKLGAEDLSKKIYLKAATIYVQITKIAIHRSTRELLWALQKAYENFVLAGEISMAEAVHNEYMALAMRSQPSIVEIKSPVLKSNAISDATSDNVDLPENVVNAVNLFLEQQTSLN